MSIEAVLARISSGRVIGIDPDLKKSGVAVGQKPADEIAVALQSLHNLDLFDLMAFIDEHKADAVFFLEDVKANKSLYAKHCHKNERVKQRIAQNVGQVKAIAEQIEVMLARSGALYVMVRPFTGTLKKAKDDPALFERLTGWDGRSNQDTRDAGILAVYGPVYKNTWRVPA